MEGKQGSRSRIKIRRIEIRNDCIGVVPRLLSLLLLVVYPYIFHVGAQSVGSGVMYRIVILLPGDRHDLNQVCLPCPDRTWNSEPFDEKDHHSPDAHIRSTTLFSGVL